MKGLHKIIYPFAPDQSGAVSVLYELGGLLVVCDAGGCAGNICGFDEPRWGSGRNAGRSAVFSAGLRDMDAILGRDTLLVEKMARAAAHMQASFAAIIGTPVPATIATDYRAVQKMAEERCGMPVLAIETNGIRWYDQGAEAAYLALFKTFAEDTAQREEGLWQAWLRLETATAAEHFARGGMALEQRFVGAFEHYVAAVGTRARAEIHDVVGHADHLLMVLHEQHRVARIAQPLHGVLHELYVVVVQARAGFVEDVEYVGERRVDVFGNLASLCFTARECTDGAVEAQITETNLLQCSKPGTDCFLQVDSQRIGERTNPGIQLRNR